MCIAQGNNTVPPVGSNLQPFHLQSRNLPLSPSGLGVNFLTRAGKVVIKFPKIISYIIICYY